jgi:hypothetical protein
MPLIGGDETLDSLTQRNDLVHDVMSPLVDESRKSTYYSCSNSNAKVKTPFNVVETHKRKMALVFD